MAENWEEWFVQSAQPPGKTEQEKCGNAERAIRKAIEASKALQQRDVAVFPQGSYRNRTNNSTESDVDIAIRLGTTFFYDLPDGAQPGAFGVSTPPSYSYAQFKNDVGEALSGYLGVNAVKRGKNAFDVHENSYRIDADALACLEYRLYREDGTYLEGTAFVPDGGSRIINWPDQNYANGVVKNDATGRRFKAIVRILKSLRSAMAAEGDPIATTIASYLIECLAWNVPNEGFGHETLTDDVRYVLAHLCNETRADETCREWAEVNEYKYLFHPTQRWTRHDANAFLNAAWNRVGFK